MATHSLSKRIGTGGEMDQLLKASYRAGIESREQPLYTVTEAAYYLGINSHTLTTWLFGRSYPTKQGDKPWLPVITPADPDLRLLSFYNLAEAHVLAATRYEHRVPFEAVRAAIDALIERYPESASHPLLADDFHTNGKLLFIKTINELVNLSSRQLSLEIMDAFLVRVLRDVEGKTFKLYPLRKGETNDKIISIVAGVAASRPIIDGSGIPVSAVWRRFNAGEEPKEIAEDFELDVAQVNRAISYIERRAA